MKLHEALRKVIRHFGVNVIEEKRLMSFLADYKAFDDYPAVKEVMRAIATGDSGKKICLAADGSDEEFLRLASEIKEKLVSEMSFKEEFARYAVDSVSFALGIVSNVTEPGDHGYEAVQRNAGNNGSAAAQYIWSRPEVWQKASDGAESHRRFYRGHDLTAAFESGEFSRNVADGSFRDIFPGDYIRKKITVPAVANLKTSTYDVKFIIADLDIAMDQGTPRVTAHHAIIVPEEPVFYTYMNPSDTNAGGYAESYMHKTVMPAFAQGLIGAFGEKHLLKSSFDGSDSTASNPLSCICRLMTLSMVFGQLQELPGGVWHWSQINMDNCLAGEQFAAFRNTPNLQGKRMWYWLSDTPSSWIFFSSTFATVADYGLGVRAHANDASYPGAGIRPFALLV